MSGSLQMHVPIRPTWLCAADGAEWPCSGAKARLLAEFDKAPASLGLYLAAHFMDACVDLHRQPAGDLYRRFLGWRRSS